MSERPAVSRAGPRRRPALRELVAAAEKSRAMAHAPYSRLRIGAALLADDGRIFTGSNVENASYGLTVCAERVALWNAVSQGARQFVALAVAGPARRATAPCGACRQVLAEFSPDLAVRYRERGGRWVTRRLRALLPSAFSLRSR